MNHTGGAALLRPEGLYLGGGFSLVGGAPAVGVGLLRAASLTRGNEPAAPFRRRRR